MGRNADTWKTRIVLAGATALAAAGVGPGPTPVRADVLNLEENLPITVEDAYPTDFRGREVQGLLRYDHTDDDPEGDDAFLAEARLELGWFYNSQIELQLPYNFGNSSDEGQGAVALEAFYNFNTEGLYLPAFALSGNVAVPYGEDSHGADTRLKLIATKGFGSAPNRPEFHLNLSWLHKFDRNDDERSDRYEIGLGYSQPLLGRADTVFVADVVRTELVRKNEEWNVAEAGVRFQFDPLTTFSAGVGAGFGDESPDFRLLVGFQRSLTIFPLY